MFAGISGWFTQYLCYAKRPEKWTAKANANTSAQDQSQIADAEMRRQDASNHAAVRSRYMIESQAAFKMGDKKTAKELADKGKAEGVEMDRLNAEAATIFFNHNNPRDDGTNDYGLVDLHGLHVKEALMYAEVSIQNEIDGKVNQVEEKEDSTPDAVEAAEKPIQKIGKEVIFIVGMGNHSEGGVRKIKPALEEMIKNKYPKFKVTEDKPHKGCIHVDFCDSVGNTAAAAGDKRSPEGTTSTEEKSKKSCVIA